jgi:hypothetical protein
VVVQAKDICRGCICDDDVDEGFLSYGLDVFDCDRVFFEVEMRVEEIKGEFLVTWFVVLVGKIAVGALIISFVQCEDVIMHDVLGEVFGKIFFLAFADEEDNEREKYQHSHTGKNRGKEFIFFHGKLLLTFDGRKRASLPLFSGARGDNPKRSENRNEKCEKSPKKVFFERNTFCKG